MFTLGDDLRVFTDELPACFGSQDPLRTLSVGVIFCPVARRIVGSVFFVSWDSGFFVQRGL
jgi:hypothetical protein